MNLADVSASSTTIVYDEGCVYVFVVRVKKHVIQLANDEHPQRNPAAVFHKLLALDLPIQLSVPVLFILRDKVTNPERRRIINVGKDLGFTNVYICSKDYGYLLYCINTYEIPVPSYVTGTRTPSSQSEFPDGSYIGAIHFTPPTMRGFVMKQVGSEILLQEVYERWNSISDDGIQNFYQNMLQGRKFEHVLFECDDCYLNIIVALRLPFCKILRQHTVPHRIFGLVRLGLSITDPSASSNSKFITPFCYFDIRFGRKRIHIVNCALRKLPFSDSIKLLKTSNDLEVYIKRAGLDGAQKWSIADRITLPANIYNGDEMEMGFSVDENSLISFNLTKMPSYPLAEFTLGHECMTMKQLINGRYCFLNSVFGQPNIPAYISFRYARSCVGEEALQDLVDAPEFVVYDLLKLVGRTYDEIDINPAWPFLIERVESNQVYISVQTFQGRKGSTPTMFLALMIKAMVLHVESKLNTFVDRVQFKLPTDFHQEKLRNAVRTAADLADIKAVF